MRLYRITSVLLILATFLLYACSNSEYIDNADGNAIFADDSAIDVRTIDKQDSTDKDQQNKSSDNNGPQVSSSSIKNYLPLDDTEYPYAGIPRIVIETENHCAITDRETEIPAKLQIWGKNAPESEIMDLTIRGRGNTSWTHMPKNSYKIEFKDKHKFFGMPENRDWALISNYADKTLLKNFISYKLSSMLNVSYSPRCEHTELYLNGQYLGTYLLTETIKVDKQRVNIPKNRYSYLAEFDFHYRDDDQVIFLADTNYSITVHHPKEVSEIESIVLKEHLDSLTALLSHPNLNIDTIEKWLDFESYLSHYWVQEFSENRDANFHTSVFFSWVTGEPIKMGPVWDFDIGYGGHMWVLCQDPEKWFIRNYFWNTNLFKNQDFLKKVNNYWQKNHNSFEKILDTIQYYSDYIEASSQNNFKRWNILKKADSWYHLQAYKTHQESVDSLKNWITRRIKWIDKQIETLSHDTIHY